MWNYATWTCLGGCLKTKRSRFPQGTSLSFIMKPIKKQLIKNSRRLPFLNLMQWGNIVLTTIIQQNLQQLSIFRRHSAIFGVHFTFGRLLFCRKWNEPEKSTHPSYISNILKHSSSTCIKHKSLGSQNNEVI